MRGCRMGNGVEAPLSESFYQLLDAFDKSYGWLHPWLCLHLCVLGLVLNLLNLSVLSRPRMVSSVNVILSAVALCDCVVLVSSAIFLLYFELDSRDMCSGGRWAAFTRGWGRFALLHSQWTLVAHSTSLWLTVGLALLRLSTLRAAASFRQPLRLSSRETGLLCAALFLAVLAANIPNSLSFSVLGVPVHQWCPSPNPNDSVTILDDDTIQLSPRNSASEGVPLNSTLAFILLGHGNGTSLNNSEEWRNGTRAADVEAVWEMIYLPFPNPRALSRDCLLLQVSFWTTGVVFKFLPCLILTGSIVGLLLLLRRVRESRKRLGVGPNSSASADSSTNRLLLAVLTIFLLTELPQGILSVLVGLFNEEFRNRCYKKLGGVLDLFSILNSSVNFIIYCSMSAKFRDVFENLFLPVDLRRSRRRRRRPKAAKEGREAGRDEARGGTRWQSSRRRQTPGLVVESVSGRVLPTFRNRSSYSQGVPTLDLPTPTHSPAGSDEDEEGLTLSTRLPLTPLPPLSALQPLRSRLL